MSDADARQLPPVPDGWFAVAFSRDLDLGEVKRIRYFERDLVLFRTRSGRARVLDAYCPHLGAHLAEGGRVMGETVRCPFHGWQYDGATGRCVHIPYCERIPPRARVKAWEVVERNGLIFVWHHALGEPPSWQVPEVAELEDAAWEPPRALFLELDVHMQEMAENNNDPTHFHFVHGAPEPPAERIDYAEDGRSFRVTSTVEHALPGGQVFKADFLRDTFGLGLATIRITAPGVGLLMHSSTSPVERGRTHSRWLMTSLRTLADTVGEDWIKNLEAGVAQDFRIWENKIYQPSPVLCEADKNLAEFRRWSRQFYSAGRAGEVPQGE